jgi:hypothetical protein
MMKKDLIPSLLVILLGAIDCITTVLGTVYYGAKEINPFMVGIVSNLGAFVFIKIFATIFVAFTYIISRHILLRMPKEAGKSSARSLKWLKVVYLGLIAFLALVVINNLIILLG